MGEATSVATIACEFLFPTNADLVIIPRFVSRNDCRANDANNACPYVLSIQVGASDEATNVRFVTLNPKSPLVSIRALHQSTSERNFVACTTFIQNGHTHEETQAAFLRLESRRLEVKTTPLYPIAMIHSPKSELCLHCGKAKLLCRTKVRRTEVCRLERSYI